MTRNARARWWSGTFVALAIAPACHRDAPSSTKATSAATSAPVASSVPPSASADGAGGSPSADASRPAAIDTSPSPPDAVVREERDVVVDGVTERWRLEWRHPPTPECVDDAWSTCACAGLAFGERGELDLVRARPGAPEERMHLAPLFDDGEARLARWPVLPSDRAFEGKRVPIALVAKRPLVPVMKLGDYDHDGRATEMVLEVAAYACGHTPTVVVGIDRHRGLHAFTSAEQPNDPLTLESREDWERVKQKLPVDLLSVGCGDHGAEEEIRLGLSRGDDGALHAVADKHPCASP